jgi:hypothetical protein
MTALYGYLAFVGVVAYILVGMALIDLYERWLEREFCRRYHLPPSERPKRAIRSPCRRSTSP